MSSVIVDERVEITSARLVVTDLRGKRIGSHEVEVETRWVAKSTWKGLQGLMDQYAGDIKVIEEETGRVLMARMDLRL